MAPSTSSHFVTGHHPLPPTTTPSFRSSHSTQGHCPLPLTTTPSIKGSHSYQGHLFTTVPLPPPTVVHLSDN
ncbi:hypothetical protein Taro_045388 [Colocasia esculenta]|uniref:Uncharacterized protein n=1 Tax=Colocasia esculenta TaxID=4460 RepID=A0A843X452_COLES|nr:hypothetical protein [Colocasia esculenta]